MNVVRNRTKITSERSFVDLPQRLQREEMIGVPWRCRQIKLLYSVSSILFVLARSACCDSRITLADTCIRWLIYATWRIAPSKFRKSRISAFPHKLYAPTEKRTHASSLPPVVYKFLVLPPKSSCQPTYQAANLPTKLLTYI